MNKASEFLKVQHMHPDDVDLSVGVNDFLTEMEAGLAGNNSSLRMIPTYIQADRTIPFEEPVIAIDAGGTHFRVATAQLHLESEPEIKYVQRYAMPGTGGPVSKDSFFRTVTDYLRPVLDQSDRIGFVFSYPTEILPNLDGRLIQFCKEVEAPEVVGELMGDNLNRTLRTQGQAEKRIALLNDTVATLLAGRGACQGQDYDSYIGFILGTGTNCCYIEANDKILKLPDIDPKSSQIVNVESGAFGLAPRGTVDRLLDESSMDPGQYTFEKMLSGGYFGQLILLTLQEAARNGLFVSPLRENIQELKSLSCQSVDALLQNRAEEDTLVKLVTKAVTADQTTVVDLIKLLIQRSAKLTAANLASVVLKSGAGKDPARPVCITAEGTTFYQLHGLKAQVHDYLDDFLEKQHQRYYRIIAVDNATLIGAALAGLTV